MLTNLTNQTNRSVKFLSLYEEKLKSQVNAGHNTKYLNWLCLLNVRHMSATSGPYFKTADLDS